MAPPQNRRFLLSCLRASVKQLSMSEFWLEIRIRVPGDEVDLVCARLEACGSCGVTVAEAALDTFVPPDPDELFGGVQELRAYFPGQPAEQLFERLRAELADLPRVLVEQDTVTEVRNADWAESWKQHFTALRIGRRLVIRPSWEERTAEPGVVEVVLDPGMAFGTGTHGTTRLCLEALAAAFESDSPPRRVLDVGTGSGILAIAAARLGADHVLACDIDDEVCRVASENVAANGVDRLVEVTRMPLETLPQGYDLVVANILAEENVRLASELVRRLSPGGRLILSGILREKENYVIEGFRSHFPGPPRVSHEDEWSCLVYLQGGG